MKRTLAVLTMLFATTPLAAVRDLGENFCPAWGIAVVEHAKADKARGFSLEDIKVMVDLKSNTREKQATMTIVEAVFTGDDEAVEKARAKAVSDCLAYMKE